MLLADKLQRFADGFVAMRQEGADLWITDLRMGQEPAYVFAFAVAQRLSPPVPLARIEQIAVRPDLARGLPWLWRRALGEPLPPPR